MPAQYLCVSATKTLGCFYIYLVSQNHRLFTHQQRICHPFAQVSPQEIQAAASIHGGFLERPEVDTFVSPQAETLHIQGLRHRKLARLWFLQKPGLIHLAKGIDKALLGPWGGRARRIMEEKLTQALAGVDIFHTSDVLSFAPPGIKTVTTIHDMTTLLFPEHHTEETIELQQQKFTFAREEADD